MVVWCTQNVRRHGISLRGTSHVQQVEHFDGYSERRYERLQSLMQDHMRQEQSEKGVEKLN